MIDITYFTLKHAFDTGARDELFDSLRPTNGFESVELLDSHLTFVHKNSRISWRLDVHSYESILGHEQLGDELVGGGCGEYGVLQFPNDFGWAKQDEAVVFWSKVLPVKPLRILFTYTELCCVYIQLANGMIASLKLFWDNEEMEDEAVIKTIFTNIIESNQSN